MAGKTVTALFGSDSDVLREPSFQVMLAATVIGTMGVAPLSPILDALTQPYGVSETRVGLLLSAYSAPGIVFIPIAGLLADRYGRKPLLLGGLVLFGATGVAVPLTAEFRIALGIRFLQGIGFAAIIPITITVVGDLYEGAQETTAQGLRFTFSGLSQTVFPLLTGSLVLLSWQYPFAIYVLSFPAAALVYRSFPESHLGTASAGEGVPNFGGTVARLARLARRRWVFPILVARSLPEFLYLGFYTFISPLVRSAGGGPQEAGVLVAIASVCFAAAASQSGRLVAAFPGTISIATASAGAIWLGLSLLAFAPASPVAMIGVAVLGVGIGLSLTIYRSLLTGLAPDDQRGGLVGLGETFGRVASTVSPVVIGAVVELAAVRLGFSLAVRAALFAVATVGCLLIVVAVVVAQTAPRPDDD